MVQSLHKAGCTITEVTVIYVFTELVVLYIPHKDCSLQTRCLVTVQGGTLTDPASNGLFRECTALWGNINMVHTNNIADIIIM